MVEQINGSCHCGNVCFTFDWPADQSEIPVRACTCSFCQKHGGRWTSHPSGQFSLQVATSARMTIYRFGSETADFHVCANCGVVPIVTCWIEDQRFAVVNANSFIDIDGARLVEMPMNFDAEPTQARLARRRTTWTPEAR